MTTDDMNQREPLFILRTDPLSVRPANWKGWVVLGLIITLSLALLAVAVVVFFFSAIGVGIFIAGTLIVAGIASLFTRRRQRQFQV